MIPILKVLVSVPKYKIWSRTSLTCWTIGDNTGTIRDYTEPCGNIQDYSEPYWTMQDHTGPHRTIPDQTEPNGTILDHMEPGGHIGPCRTILDHTRAIRNHTEPYRTIP